MSKSITIGKSDNGHAVKLDIPRLIVSRALVTAASGGGKSWLLRVILEAVSATTQTIVIDPEGEFASLRKIRDMVLVGPDGDLAADPRSAGLLCRRLMEQNVSAVIDIFELTPTKRREFVAAFCTEMVNLPKDLWRPCFIAIDEAHEFAPKVADKHDIALEPVSLLFSKGRKRGYAPIIATQRLAKLHNDVAAEAKNRFIGQTVLDVDQRRAADFLGWGKDRWPDLRDLSPPGREGEWFGVGPALSDRGVVKFRAGAVKSHHPRAGEAGHSEPPQPSKKIAAVLGELKDLPRQVEEEARTVAQLKAENVELKRQVKSRPVVNDEAAVARAVAAAEQRARSELSKQVSLAGVTSSALKRQLESIMKVVAEIRARGFEGTTVPPEQIEAAVRAATGQVVTMYEKAIKSMQVKVERNQADLAKIAEQLSKMATDGVALSVDVKHSPPFAITTSSKSSTRAERSESPRTPTSGPAEGSLPKGELAVLIACAQHADGCDRAQLTTLIGYKKSSRDTYIGKLIGRGYLTNNSDRLVATPEGIAAAGDFESIPTGSALLDWHLGRLPEGERKILSFVADQYPAVVTRDAISEATQYQKSSRDTYIGKLASRKLLEVSREGVKAVEHLFD